MDGLRLYTLLILAFTCIGTSYQIQTIQDPCNPSTSVVILRVSDSLGNGSKIAELNSSTSLNYVGDCSHSSIENNNVFLKLKLRDPCYPNDPPPPSCKLGCGNITKDVHLDIQHEDMYPPEFPQSFYQTTIPENLEVGGTVFDIAKDATPTDPDCGSPSFSLSFYQPASGNGSIEGPFLLPGIGPLMLRTPVDYETVQQYNVYIQVKTDNNKSATTLINVLIQDVDDNDPEFIPTFGYVLQFDEETTLSSISSNPPLFCRDMDRGINQTVIFSFKDYEDSQDFLTIDSSLGTFDVIKSLDREENSSYVFELWCYQNDKHDKKAFTTIQIEVLDINDNPAIFEPVLYDVTLVENAIGYVTTVMATDADIGDNAVILYDMVDGPQSDILQVDERTGIVTIASPEDLDRETMPNITVQIRAKDLDGNYSTNTATVVITLLDINDNSPKFELPAYLFNLNATHSTGVIGQVKAHDEDKADTPNSNVTYSLYYGSTHVPFTVDTLTGEVSTADTMNASTDYNFIIQACDNPENENDRRCGMVNVRVVYGKNLTFSSHDIYIEVAENVPIDTRIGDTLPVIGEMYTTSSPDFDVDVANALLVTKTMLDRETNDTYYIHVNVWEYNMIKGNITVTLNVTDVNDNAPVFLDTEYYLTIPQNAGAKTFLGVLNATDDDVGQNAKLAFGFKNIYSDQFEINSITGEVSTSSQLKQNNNILFHLIAEVTDHGEPPLNAVVPVYISHMVLSDNNVVGIPTSLPKSVFMSASNKTSIETKMGTILGFDRVQIINIQDDKSLMYINASTENGTVVPSISILRSAVENWSPIQDMFREFMEPRVLTSDDTTTLNAPEIALIAVSGVILIGSIISIIIVCRQWNQHLKNHKLYDSLRRPSNLYDSQEITMNFGDEIPSRLNTFNTRRSRSTQEDALGGSFGMGYVNSAFADGEPAPKTPTWSTGNTPRIPRWSTSDSIKDAMLSLDELTNRLNSEDNISRVTNLSRSRLSLKSNYSETHSEKTPNGILQSTPRDATGISQSTPGDGTNTNQSTSRNGESESWRLYPDLSDLNQNLSSDNGVTQGDIMTDIQDEFMDDGDQIPVIAGDDTIEVEATAF